MLRKCAIVISAFIFAPFHFACTNSSLQVRVKQMGSRFVKARFLNDSIIEGKAETYDSLNHLVEIAHYKNGVKEGLDVQYLLSGKIKDSSFYSKGILNGLSCAFDSAGKILIIRNYYYGLQAGSNYSFDSGKIKQYLFLDFEKNGLVICDYDSFNRVTLSKFKSQPILTDAQSGDGKPMLNLFLYFPTPPMIKTVYKFGLSNEKHEVRNEKQIDSNRLFLDTLLQFPPTGWYYFVSTDLENIKDSINQIYFYELHQ